MSKDNKDHEVAIEVFVDNYRNDRSRAFHVLLENDLDKSILKDHYIQRLTVKQIARKYGISEGTVSGFITDYRLANYVDSEIEETAVLDAENHLGIMNLFFSNAMFLSREASLTSVLARKVREEIAESITERGALETAKDKSLMRAWETVTRKTMDYSANAGKFMDTYLKLLEKVLDKQRDLAFIKVLYDVVSKLEPATAEKLQEAMAEDEYARAVMSSLSGETILRVFQARAEKTSRGEAEYVDNILGVEDDASAWED